MSSKNKQKGRVERSDSVEAGLVIHRTGAEKSLCIRERVLPNCKDYSRTKGSMKGDKILEILPPSRPGVREPNVEIVKNTKYIYEDDNKNFHIENENKFELKKSFSLSNSIDSNDTTQLLKMSREITGDKLYLDVEDGEKSGLLYINLNYDKGFHNTHREEKSKIPVRFENTEERSDQFRKPYAITASLFPRMADPLSSTTFCVNRAPQTFPPNNPLVYNYDFSTSMAPSGAQTVINYKNLSSPFTERPPEGLSVGPLAAAPVLHQNFKPGPVPSAHAPSEIFNPKPLDYSGFQSPLYHARIDNELPLSDRSRDQSYITRAPVSASPESHKVKDKLPTPKILRPHTTYALPRVDKKDVALETRNFPNCQDKSLNVNLDLLETKQTLKNKSVASYSTNLKHDYIQDLTPQVQKSLLERSSGFFSAKLNSAVQTSSHEDSRKPGNKSYVKETVDKYIFSKPPLTSYLRKSKEEDCSLDHSRTLIRKLIEKQREQESLLPPSVSQQSLPSSELTENSESEEAPFSKSEMISLFEKSINPTKNFLMKPTIADELKKTHEGTSNPFNHHVSEHDSVGSSNAELFSEESSILYCVDKSTIKIRNLPSDMKVRDIQRVFPHSVSVTKPHIEIEDNQSVRCAYVLFLSTDDAEKSLRTMKGAKLGGRKVTIEFRRFLNRN